MKQEIKIIVDRIVYLEKRQDEERNNPNVMVGEFLRARKEEVQTILAMIKSLPKTRQSLPKKKAVRPA